MNKKDEKIELDLGCFGILLEIIGILGIIYIFNHWDMIMEFITK